MIANNLANASTGAFKRDLAIFQAEHPYDVENGIAGDLPGNLNQSTGGLSLAEIVTDFSDGPVVQTGGTFDVALSGPGFLRISDGQQQFLTRNGNLTLNDRGELVTQETGLNVLDGDGVPIKINLISGDVEIGSNGSIVQVGDQGARAEIARLDLVRPASLDDLKKVGNSMFRTDGNLLPADQETAVRQGYVELSGTRSIREMMQMIEASRAFETNMNMIKFQDEALGQLLQSMSRR